MHCSGPLPAHPRCDWCESNFSDDGRWARSDESLPMRHVFAIPVKAAGFDVLRLARSIGVRQVRILCGLILFAYLVSHLTNHALGNVSYEAMEAWLLYHMWWWRSLLLASDDSIDGFFAIEDGALRGSAWRCCNHSASDMGSLD